ncbi:MAG: SNF2-related protein, partial [Stackebrandtia sp.]
MLPAQLQATYRPDIETPAHGLLVWWGGGADLVESVRKHGLPDGAPGRLRLALPTPDGIRGERVPVRLVPLTQAAPALAGMRVDKHTSDSVRAWRAAAMLALSHPDPERLAALAGAMPTAAHAVCREDGGLWSPEVLVNNFAHAALDTYLSEKDEFGVLSEAQDELATDAKVEAELRPYQRRGFAWLRSIAGHHRGALLADDMGLGKTLQTIALLADRDSKRPHLVVCPTSVVGNWARELKRFAPQLPVVRHHGPNRREVARFGEGTVVVTTYD